MKIEIEFAYTLTGKVLADFTVDYCKTLANAAVSQTSMTLTEIGFGVYVLDNPNVTVDTILRMHLTADATQYITTKFSLSDGNTALETTGNVAAVKTKTDYLPSVTAGANGGVFIAGTNAATTITTGLTTTFTGNLTGSVASVTGLTASDVGNIKTQTDKMAFTVTNKQDVNVYNWNGTAVATPATAGIPDINVKNMNNVAATSITAINANQGTTQPINFTGTAANALAKSDMIDIASAAVSTTAAQIGVNSVQQGGTVQTGRDLGLSVLLSSGTGTGQLDFTSGVVKANLAQILGTALTETATYLAAGFKKFFNVATPTGTVNSIPDAVAGATNGISIVGSAQALTSAYDFAKGTVAMTEAYSVDGAAATPAQILHMIWSMLAEKSVTSTIVTCKKLDGTTGAMTFTLNSATAPTAITRNS